MTDPTTPSIQTIIETWLDEAKIGPVEASRKLGVSNTTFWRWRRGEGLPNDNKFRVAGTKRGSDAPVETELMRLAKEVGIPIEQLRTTPDPETYGRRIAILEEQVKSQGEAMGKLVKSMTMLEASLQATPTTRSSKE
jgi:hypothetical protein